MEVAKHNSERDLERWLDAEIKRLPLIKAPSDLQDKIISAVARRERQAWLQRPYQQWNAFQKTAFIVVCLFAIVGCLWISWKYSASLVAWENPLSLSEIPNVALMIFNLLVSLANIIFLIVEANKFWLLGFVVFTAILYCVCVAVGSAGVTIAVKSLKEIQNENHI